MNWDQERDQVAVIWAAGIKDDGLLVYERLGVLRFLCWIEQRKFITLPPGAAVLLVVLWAVCEWARDTIILGLEGQEPVIAFRPIVVDCQRRPDQSRFGIPALVPQQGHAKLMDIACKLAAKYGLSLPPGLKAWDKKKHEERQRLKNEKLKATLAENAATQKSGITPEQRRSETSSLYESSDSSIAFRAAQRVIAVWRTCATRLRSFP